MPSFNTTTFGSGLFGGSSTTPPVGIPASDIVYAAYRKINVLGSARRGYSPSQGQDGLDVLNRLLDSWNTEQLVVWNELRIVRDLVMNQQDYEIGQGALDFPDIPRPLKIDGASIIMNPLSAQPLEIPISIWTYQQWQSIVVKPLPTPLPQGVYYETSNPVGVLHYWPVPADPIQMVIYVAQQLSQVADLDTLLIIPPGYARALVFNLAVELADDFPRATLKPMTVQIAADSKAWIKRRNIRPMDIYCDPALLGNPGFRGRWNIYTGYYNGPR